MNDDSVGALWEKQGPKGLYYSGNIEVNGEKIGVVGFLNKNKKNPKQPDIRILKAQKRDAPTNTNGLDGVAF